MIEVTSKGDYKQTKDFLNKMKTNNWVFSDLNRYGEMGVAALSKATPVDTGRARNSWGYRVIRDRKRPGIEWYNSDIEGGLPVVILIQYGHGTGNGGYVVGRDFINPAMRPVFDKIADEIWKKVTNG